MQNIHCTRTMKISTHSKILHRYTEEKVNQYRELNPIPIYQSFLVEKAPSDRVRKNHNNPISVLGRGLINCTYTPNPFDTSRRFFYFFFIPYERFFLFVFFPLHVLCFVFVSSLIYTINTHIITHPTNSIIIRPWDRAVNLGQPDEGDTTTHCPQRSTYFWHPLQYSNERPINNQPRRANEHNRLLCYVTASVSLLVGRHNNIYDALLITRQ